MADAPPTHHTPQGLPDPAPDPGDAGPAGLQAAARVLGPRRWRALSQPGLVWWWLLPAGLLLMAVAAAGLQRHLQQWQAQRQAIDAAVLHSRAQEFDARLAAAWPARRADAAAPAPSSAPAAVTPERAPELEPELARALQALARPAAGGSRLDIVDAQGRSVLRALGGAAESASAPSLLPGDWSPLGGTKAPAGPDADDLKGWAVRHQVDGQDLLSWVALDRPDALPPGAAADRLHLWLVARADGSERLAAQRAYVADVLPLVLLALACMGATLGLLAWREQQLEALRLSTAGTLRAAQATAWSWPLNDEAFYCDELMGPLLGRTPESTRRFTIADLQELVHPEDRGRLVLQPQAAALRPGEVLTWDLRLRHTSGHWVHLESQAGLIPGSAPWRSPTLIGISMDVTARQAQRKELQRAQQRLETVAQNARFGFWEYDTESRSFIDDQPTRSILGLTQASANRIEDHANRFEDPGMQQTVLNAWRCAIDYGIPFEFDGFMFNSRGERLWVREGGYPEMVRGRCVRVVGFLQDMTTQHAVQQALADANEHLQAVATVGNVGFWHIDLKTGKVHRTRPLREMLGIENDEELSIEQTLALYVPDAEGRRPTAEGFRRTIATGQPYDVTAEMVNRRGQRRWIRAAGFPVSENGRCVAIYGCSQDMTELIERRMAMGDPPLASAQIGPSAPWRAVHSTQ